MKHKGFPILRRVILFFLILANIHISLGQDHEGVKDSLWWKPGRPSLWMRPNRSGALSLVKVEGNRFVNSLGDTLIFRGVSIADPDKIAHEGHWDKNLFEQVRKFGATLVRIPVHPVAWRLRGTKGYLNMLDSAVTWSTELHLYVDIDWHSIGNLEMGLFQAPMYQTSLTETCEFWRTIARHFSGNNTVAFYEIFNEPTTYRGQLGHASWSKWKAINENIIGLIRAFDQETIPLVAGFDWAYDLTPLREDPINASGIGYVTHPYPNKRTQPWEPKWEEDFGFASEKYPLLATEIGFSVGEGDPPDGVDHYGTRITRYLEKNGIGWVAWDFDPEWGPTLLKSWNYDLSPSGEFFRKVMQGH